MKIHTLFVQKHLLNKKTINYSFVRDRMFKAAFNFLFLNAVSLLSNNFGRLKAGTTFSLNLIFASGIGMMGSGLGSTFGSCKSISSSSFSLENENSKYSR